MSSRSSSSAQSQSIDDLKSQLSDFSARQKELFVKRHPVSELVFGRAKFIDTVLQNLWSQYDLSQQTNISLIAVGGYGRGELHPLSDIDILIISPETLEQKTADLVGQFITTLWDLSLIHI